MYALRSGQVTANSIMVDYVSGNKSYYTVKVLTSVWIYEDMVIFYMHVNKALSSWHLTKMAIQQIAQLHRN